MGDIWQGGRPALTVRAPPTTQDGLGGMLTTGGGPQQIPQEASSRVPAGVVASPRGTEKRASGAPTTMSLTQLRSLLHGWPWNVCATRSSMDRARHQQQRRTGRLRPPAATAVSSLKIPFRLSVLPGHPSESGSQSQVGTAWKRIHNSKSGAGWGLV